MAQSTTWSAQFHSLPGSWPNCFPHIDRPHKQERFHSVNRFPQYRSRPKTFLGRAFPWTFHLLTASRPHPFACSPHLLFSAYSHSYYCSLSPAASLSPFSHLQKKVFFHLTFSLTLLLFLIPANPTFHLPNFYYCTIPNIQ